MGRTFRVLRPWPTARQIRQRTALWVGAVGALQIVLDALDPFAEPIPMLRIRVAAAFVVGTALFRIETVKAKPGSGRV